MEVVCFHTPGEENGYLSNWYTSRFTYEGTAYTSMEQYMMHRKALFFGDAATAAEILETDDPAEVKELGRKVSGFDDHRWNGVRQIVVYEGLLAKFRQNPDLGAKLLSTGTATLAECAVHDRIWGIGRSYYDPARFDPDSWNGRNLLGYALMAVRSKLRGA